MALLLRAVPAQAQVFRLPDSDQRKCYRDVSPYDEIACAGTGQDGAYIQNPLSYTDNGNTVTDNNTGLVWQKNDDGTTHTWQEAMDACGALDLGGANDWRLPSKKELISIVDVAIPYPGPTVNPVFTNTKASDYWSSTSFAGVPDVAWSVDFSNSSVGAGDTSNTSYVRCVRGGQTPGPTLIDNGNGTVTDSRTGLIWQQDEPGAKTWGSALSYCEGLDLGGSTSWRLPNYKELESLTDDTSPAIDTGKFPNAHSDYWSSTSYAGNPDYAWIVDFNNGYVSAYGKNGTSYVRCVRGGQSGSFGNWRSGEVDLGGGWKWTSWFGIYNTTYEPWVYHAQHEWLYPYDNGNGAVFFWYDDMQQFVWTTPTTYPFLYRFGANAAWLWYLKDSANPRWFYNYTSGIWESLP